MRNYNQAGDVVTLPAPSNVTSGQAVLIGDLVCIALRDASSGAMCEFQTSGVVTMRKATGTINVGVRVFWDNAASRVTTTAASNRCIGVHVGQANNAGADNTAIDVLLGPRTAVAA
jgi:predicted RecA/RadA family phage recombinase